MCASLRLVLHTAFMHLPHPSPLYHAAHGWHRTKLVRGCSVLQLHLLASPRGNGWCVCVCVCVCVCMYVCCLPLRQGCQKIWVEHRGIAGAPHLPKPFTGLSITQLIQHLANSAHINCSPEQRRSAVMRERERKRERERESLTFTASRCLPVSVCVCVCVSVWERTSVLSKCVHGASSVCLWEKEK